MKKDSILLMLTILLFALLIKYIEPNLNDITKSLNDLFSSVQITSVNIDNNKIYSYSNNSSETADKKVPDYYNNYEFDKDLYIYYTLLNEKEKIIYKQIYENALSYNKEVELITTIKIDELKETIEAIYNDHPELFYLDTNYTYKYNTNNDVVAINLQYNETINNIEYNKRLFENKVNEIVASAKELSSDYKKEMYVYEKILATTEYDKEAKLNQSAFSTLVLGKSVCAGYSRAFQLILQRLEIPTYYVLGYANEEHAWNIVKLSGEYYNVDLTWDDTGRIYNHFNITDKELSNTHSRRGISINLPECTYYTYRYQ